MGYAYYEIETPDGKPMERGYSVECKCDQKGCKSKIDRGLGFLCYGCTFYFCAKHLIISEAEAVCFAGRSSQLCKQCDARLTATN